MWCNRNCIALHCEAPPHVEIVHVEYACILRTFPFFPMAFVFFFKNKPLKLNRNINWAHFFNSIKMALKHSPLWSSKGAEGYIFVGIVFTFNFFFLSNNKSSGGRWWWRRRLTQFYSLSLDFRLIFSLSVSHSLSLIFLSVYLRICMYLSLYLWFYSSSVWFWILRVFFISSVYQKQVYIFLGFLL